MTEFKLNLPTNKALLGYYVNGNKKFPVFFDDIKSGYKFYHQTNTSEWLNNIKPTCGANVCNIKTSGKGDGNNWKLVDILPIKTVFELVADYFNREIWPQFQSQDVSKCNAFGETVSHFFAMNIEGWNKSMWEKNAITMLGQGYVKDILSTKDIECIVNKVRDLIGEN